MKKSHYSNTAYGRMRDRQLKEKKQELQMQTVDKVKRNAPYKTILANL